MVEVKFSPKSGRRWSHAHSFWSGATLCLGLLLVAFVGISIGFLRLKAFLPQTRIAGVDVSWLDGESAAFLLGQKIGSTPDQFELTYQGKSWSIDQKELGLTYDLPSTINQAWLIGRQGSLWERIGQIQHTLQGQTNLELAIKLDEAKLRNLVAGVASKLDDPAIEPSLRVVNKKNMELSVEPGKNGKVVDQEQLSQVIKLKFSQLDFNSHSLELNEIKVALNAEEAKAAVDLGKKFFGRQLAVKSPDEDDWVLDENDLISLITLSKPGFSQENLQELVDEYSQAVNREPQNAAFRFTEGKVKEFRPARDGIKVSRDKLLAEINSNFDRLQRESVSLDAPITKTAPAVTTESVNNLGIKERLGLGESTYKHSIPNRIYNVSLTSSRLDGVLVAPGDTFSFNDAIGDVSAATGYKSAYVIKEGRTVLGDGGGVCQVSTTLFRAALGAGLPIEERKAHAYRVGYYEQDSAPGIDATVYSPSADLKFKNNTANWLLVQTDNNPKTQELTIEIYGTSDGRKVTLSEPSLWGQSPPPPPLYQDDPSLAPGEVKQVDWAAWGAKTRFDYKVVRGDQVLEEKTFYSTYRPWQAVYLRGPQI